MHACVKEAEATRRVCLFEGPEKSYMGSKQPPGERQLPQNRQALLPLGWSDVVQGAGELAKAPTPHQLSSRNPSASAAREGEQQWAAWAVRPLSASSS